MMHQFPPDIEALIQAQMASGNFHSQEDLFRVALEQLAAQDEEVRASKRASIFWILATPGFLRRRFRQSPRKYNIPADA